MRGPLLGAALIWFVGCRGLDDEHREILLNRITDMGEVVAVARPDVAARARADAAALRSDVAANLR